MKSARWNALALLVGGWGLARTALAEEPPQVHAVIIGVTEYTHLPQRSLIGPGNDARLMQDVLSQLGVPDEQVTVLADPREGESYEEPTRANILEALQEVIAKASTGDQVYLHFGGHGTRAPVTEGDTEELDGMDELFLPKDIERWDAAVQNVPGAIREEFHLVWLNFHCSVVNL